MSAEARALVDERERGLRSEDGVSLDSYHYVQGHDLPGYLPVLWQGWQEQHQQQQHQQQQQAVPLGVVFPFGGVPVVGPARFGKATGPDMQKLP